MNLKEKSKSLAPGAQVKGGQNVREKLWNILKDRQTYGLAFRRNEMIGRHCVDYCCHAERIVVEISDFPFESADKMDATMERHICLMDAGYTILGFDASTIHGNPRYIRDMIKTHVQINHAGSMEHFDFDQGF